MGSRLIRAGAVLILSLAVCLSITTMGLAAEDVSSIAKKILPGTVFIQTYDANGKFLGQGSGFFVSEKGDIITCYHVMRGYSSANVTTSDRKEYRVKNITAINKTNDLIKLSLSTTDHDFNSLKLNTTLPEVGQEIVVVGGPLGLENTVSNGIVSAIRNNETQITAPISPGSSGGPVANMKGEVIGIVSAQMKFGQNLNFAIPTSLISTMQPASAGLVEELLAPDNSIEIEGSDAPLWAIWGYPSEEAFLKSGANGLGLTEAYNAECNRRYSEKYIEAIQCYDCILKNNPSYAQSWNNKGVALYHLNRFEEALVCFNNSIENDLSIWEYWQNKGATLWRLHREKEAEAAFSKPKEYHIYKGWITRLQDPRPSAKGRPAAIG